MTVLCVSVFFIGLGGIIEKTSAKFKSDERALELIKLARTAIGGEANINAVKSMTIAGNTTNFFEKDGIQEAKEGNLEINLQLPGQFSKMLKIGDPGSGNDGEIDKRVKVIVMEKGDGDNMTWKTEGGDGAKTDGKKIVITKDANGNVLTENVVGPKTIIVKDKDGKVLTEDATGAHKIIVDKDVKISGDGIRQNELLRTTLALLLTAPEGANVNYLYKGESTIDGFAVNVIEAQTGDSSFKLYLDKSSNLPKMISFLGMDTPQIFQIRTKPASASAEKDAKVFVRTAGDSATVEHQIKFSDYRSVSGLLLPFAWMETVGGKQSQNTNITNYEINPANIADKFQNQKIFVRTQKPQ